MSLTLQDWEDLDNQAKALGINRTKLITLIAQSDISENEIVLNINELSVDVVKKITKNVKEQLKSSKRQLNFYEKQAKNLEKKLEFLKKIKAEEVAL